MPEPKQPRSTNGEAVAQGGADWILGALLATFLAVLSVMPAHAVDLEPQPDAWWTCVALKLLPAETLHGSVGTWGVVIANQCEALRRGLAGPDVDAVVSLLETWRNNAKRDGLDAVGVSPPTPLAPADKRF
jgi:hypothetical protein